MPFRHLALLFCLMLAGCAPADSQTDPEHPAGSRFFSKAESKAVAVAKADLERQDGKRIDARYNVTAIPEGYSVHVSYVHRYYHGKPLFGGHCTVLVSTQWTVITILPGA